MSDEENRHRLYDVLNVNVTSSEAEIRESHRRLSRLFHPDKHASAEARSRADPRFQEIQQAFEVLSDPRLRTIYDTLGEEGLSLKLEVGQRNLNPDELRAFFLKQSKQARVEELDSLVQNRGETGLSMDARSMFGGRVVMEKHTRVGSPIPVTVARPATVRERFDDVVFRGMTLRNSWTIPFNLGKIFRDDGLKETQQAQENASAMTLTSHATISGKRQLTNFGVLATFRHQLAPKTNVEVSIPLIAPRIFRSKIIHQYNQELFMTADLAMSTLACPPDLTLTSGRQITDRGVLFGTLRSGSPWKLAGWGRYGNAASYILGWTRNPVPKDPTGYTVELITGLQVLGLAADYNTAFKSSDIKFQAGGSATTSGLAINLGATRKVTENSRLGAAITANGQSLIVKLTFSRLGQNFKLPVWIGDGLELDSILYGIMLPLGGLIAYEYLVVQPRRTSRKARKVALRKAEFEEKLLEREQTARESVELMTDAINRRQQTALSQGGLYINSASYGSKEKRIDVTVALAAQVNDNQLVLLGNQRKSNMLGFWDPDFAEKKSLRIDYTFAGRRHFVEVDDKNGAALPAQSHVV